MPCEFCEIVAGEAPSETVYTDDDCIAFMDTSPWTRGHLLVIPRTHAQDLWALTEDQAAAVMRATRRVVDRVHAGLAPEGLNLFQANGVAAFQTVFHFHMHVVPRWSDDAIRLPFLPQPGDPEAIRAAADAIRAAG